MAGRRFWLITGGVVVAGVLFGLGVIAGAMLDDDGGDADGVAGQDAEERAEVRERAGDGFQRGPRVGAGMQGPFEGLLGELVEEFLDGLGERFDAPDADDDDDERPWPDRDGPGLPDGRRFELDLFVPEDLRDLGECIRDGLDELFEGDDDEGGVLGRGRELWERCNA